MANKPRFRILNKTNKTVTIKMGDGKHTMPWEEYNATFVTEDKFWAVFNEENQKRHDEAEDEINWAVVDFMFMRAHENEGGHDFLVHSLAFGTRLEKIQKLLNCNLLEATQIIQRRLMMMNPWMANPMFTDDQLKKAGMYRSKKSLEKEMQRDMEEMESVETPVRQEVPSGKPTLGDAFSCLGDLKSKLEEEGK